MNKTNTVMEEKNSEAREVNVYNLIIIDESGSMGIIYEPTLTGINETLSTIRLNQKNHPEQHHFVSIVTFRGACEDAVRTRREMVPIDDVKDLTTEDYQPGGCTALYDAMGSSIMKLDKAIGENSIAFVTVITDGMENSSVEYSGKCIRDMVHRMKEKGWTFAYIGANQDAAEVAGSLDIENALNFDEDAEGTIRMMARYRKANTRYSEGLAFQARHGESFGFIGNLFNDEDEDVDDKVGIKEAKGDGSIIRDLAKKIFGLKD